LLKNTDVPHDVLKNGRELKAEDISFSVI